MNTWINDGEVIDRWQQVMGELLRADGYVVLWSPVEYAIGEVTLAPGIPPMRVIGDASYADSMRQFEILKRMCGADEDAMAPPKEERYWYKTVVAD